MSERIGNTEGEFSTAVFYTDDTHEYVRRWVSPQEAMEAFIHHTNSVAVRLGMVKKVIITDGLDYTNMEWKKEKGITYPPEAVGKVPKVNP